jgi:4-diphosphocytidyl-2-C-methyl-D-erythritol kinase
MLAPAKINLALVVGPHRDDGKHEVATVLQRVGLGDRLSVEDSTRPGVWIEGFEDDTIVRAALQRLAEAAHVQPRWRVRLEKSIPVAAGLGGGSSDAATALRLVNASLDAPLPPTRLHELAAELGADVPFFLTDRPQLGTGDGSDLAPLDLPEGYAVLLALPKDAVKSSTASVYESFDRRGGANGFAERRATLLSLVHELVEPRDLARLPRNDLVSSRFAPDLERLGAFRADVSGAGPAVYGLFDSRADAERATASIAGAAETWIVDPIP